PLHVALGHILRGFKSRSVLSVEPPPYVRVGARRGLQPEVRSEPGVALFAGVEGLDAITRLLADVPPRLAPDAHLVFEFGFGQEIDVERVLAQSASLALVGLRRDLQGIARTAVARRVA